MTENQQVYREKEILHAAYASEKEAVGFRQRLFVIGQQLVSLGRALQEHPREVTPLPEPQSLYDYRDGLNMDRGLIIRLCDDLRHAEEKVEMAQRQVSLLNQ